MSSKRCFAILGGLVVLSHATAAPALTIVIDIKTAAQGNTTDNIGYTVGAFNVASFGFTAAQQPTVEASILQDIRDDYYNIPTKSALAASPIPAGFQLNIDFVLGHRGTAPSNGDSEYYYAQVGTAVTATTDLGISNTIGVRSSDGLHGTAFNRQTVCSIFSNNINNLSRLTPSDALISGNLLYTTYALGNTIAHEIGHTLSLSHVNKAGSVQPSGAAGAGGLAPLMGTGAIDLPNQDRIGPREFSLSGIDGENGDVPRSQIAQLVSAVGLRAIPEPSLVLTTALLGLGLRRRTSRRRA